MASRENSTIGMPPRQLKLNMVFCILLDTMFATGWADFQVALQPLLVYLGATNSQIGMITAASGAALFGMVVSPWITVHYRTKKGYLFVTNIPYLGAIGAAGVVLLLAKTWGLENAWLLRFTLVMMLAHNFFAGFVALPHQEYIAACVPMAYRGRFSGLSATTGGLLAIGSASVATWVLSNLSEPFCYGVLFVMTWFICQSGYVSCLFAKEAPTPVEDCPKPWSRDMLRKTLHDKPYVRFIVYYVLIVVLGMPLVSFINVYGLKELGMPRAASGHFMVITQVVRLSLAALIGFATDRLGAKRLLPCWFPVFAVAAAVPVIFGTPIAVYAGVALATIAMTGWVTSTQVLAYGIPKPENRAGHYTLYLITMYGAFSVGPLTAGYALDILSYRVVFLAYAAIGVAMFPLGRMILSKLPDNIKDYY